MSSKPSDSGKKLQTPSKARKIPGSSDPASSEKVTRSASKLSNRPTRTENNKPDENSGAEDQSANEMSVKEDANVEKPPPAFKCKCKVRVHTKLRECTIQHNIENHLLMVGTVAVVSTHTIVRITQDQAGQEFIVHTDLLAIHSGHFRTWLEEQQERLDNGEDIEHDAPYVLNSILHFTFFFSWLYTGCILETETLHHDELTGELWDFGAFLEAPGFQNCLMDRARQEYDSEKDHFMRPEILYGIYLATNEDSLMRTLASDIMGKLRVVDNLDKKTKKGRKEKSTWNETLKKISVMKKNYDDALVEWEDEEGFPWDEAYRARYMVAEKSLEELWEERILKNNDDGEALHGDIYEKFKNDMSIKGRLLFAHLDKMKTRRKPKASTPVS